ncbi:DUF305 domain-containing protein [Deinococcus cavernae]|uniref:DUF305 domain-containing protein n=1 Tax=Deinococcus cavernae TaxID=2320857 RepID=UPI001F455FD9|nr:DUF305 domain-containing protein [Deinococcus cavernae]
MNPLRWSGETKKTILLTATAVLLAFPLAQAQGMDHSNMHMSQMPAMDMTSLKQLKGKAFDRAFLSAMIRTTRPPWTWRKPSYPSARTPP